MSEYQNLQELINFEWGSTKKYLCDKDTPLTDDEWNEIVKVVNETAMKNKNSIYFEKIKCMLMCVLDFIEIKYKSLNAGRVFSAEEKNAEKKELYDMFQLGWKIIKEYAVNQNTPLDSEGRNNLMKLREEYSLRSDSAYRKEIITFLSICLDFVQIKYAHLKEN